jgi:signal transduction histidine kinase
MNIDQYLFKDEAYRGERTSLKFRWILIAVVFAFILITFFRGDIKEAQLSFIPAGIFLFYNLFISFLIKKDKNIYFLRYFSVTTDIIALSMHIFINSRYFSPIAVSTTASIFIYPVLMFLAVLRYDKKLIIYATFLTLLMFNLNYFIQYHSIDKSLIDQVISSDPMGQIYKSGYLLMLGLFFLKIPNMVNRYISRQKELIEKENENKLSLMVEKREKELLQINLTELNALHQQLKQKSYEIEEQNEKLSELVQTKDRLISFISHDLKNSFSTMASIIETTKENASNLNGPEIYEVMDILYKHSVNNHILFENLLQWAKLQRGIITISKEKINLSNYCMQTRKQSQSQLDLKNLNLIIDIPQDCIILADKIMLDSICFNILGNAIKFTPRGGTIQISSIIYPNSVKIYIKDNGVGIKKEILPTIFNIDNTTTTKGTEGEKGSGFGLILCKELIERNSGSIEVESEEGIGSTFIITLTRGGCSE